MGNTTSSVTEGTAKKAEPLPNLLTYDLPKDSTYMDAISLSDDLPAFSCGAELELVLLPYRNKIARDIPGASKILEDIPLGKDYAQEVKKDSKEIIEPRKKWAQIVTLVLQTVLGKEESLPVIAAHPEGDEANANVKKLKENGLSSWYRVFSTPLNSAGTLTLKRSSEQSRVTSRS